MKRRLENGKERKEGKEWKEWKDGREGNEWEGQITVFLSLILMCILSFLLLLAESAYMAGVRCEFQMAVGSSLDSVMSQYHKELWENYRILLLDMSEQEVQEAYQMYMEQYSFPEGTIEMGQKIRAVDDGAWWIEKEIADYMKYGIWTMEFEEDELKEIQNGLSGAKELSNVAERFAGCTKEALKLEKTVRKLTDSITKANQYGDQVQEGIFRHSENRIGKAVKNYEREQKKIQESIHAYEKIAEQMREKIASAKQESMTQKEEMDLNVRQWVEQEEQQYDSYIELNGERYQEILKAGECAEKNTAILQEVEMLATEAEEDTGESEEEDGSEDAIRWGDVEAQMNGYESISVLIQKTEGDEEKADILETIKEWMEGDMLTLILGKDAKISDGKIKAKHLPSENMSERPRINGVTQILSAIQVSAYIREFFQDYQSTREETALLYEEDGLYGDTFLYKTDISNETKPKYKKEIQYETEYLLAGKKSDRENLKDAVKQIWTVRTGLNLLYLYTDAEKRGEAEGLAMAIMGSTGLAPLTPILTFFILTVWAGIEGFMDVRSLLLGNRVPIWKTRSDWNLSMEGMLNLGKDGMKHKLFDISTIDTQANENQNQQNGESAHGGYDYSSYVRLLLLMQDMRTKVYRMLDIMQITISQKQTGFEIGTCLYSVEIYAENMGNHLFFNHQFSDDTFLLQAKVQKAY